MKRLAISLADFAGTLLGAFTAIDSIVKTQGMETVQDLLKLIDNTE